MRKKIEKKEEVSVVMFSESLKDSPYKIRQKPQSDIEVIRNVLTHDDKTRYLAMLKLILTRLHT